LKAFFEKYNAFIAFEKRLFVEPQLIKKYDFLPNFIPPPNLKNNREP